MEKITKQRKDIRLIGVITNIVITEKPFENVVFETRKDAEDVLSSADDICRTYGWITVSDLYGLCCLIGSFKDNSLGWSDLSTVSIMRTKNGYQINFPKPKISYRSYGYK